MNSVRTRLGTWLRRILILSHRYLGIAISLVLVVWFASGIVMIYAGGMPQLDQQTRLERLPAVDFIRVRLNPVEAALRADLPPGTIPTLLSVQQRPAWRFQAARMVTVFADDGSLLEPLTRDGAAQVARQFAGVGVEAIHFERQVDAPDQWTLGARREMPLFKYSVEDGHGTELYVSPARGEVVQQTTTRTRALAWVGTIPHWIYFAALRTNQPLWYRIVVWLSAAACVLATLGLVLAFTQFRRTEPFSLSKSIPYRGWMRWHYISGALFGVFTLTWAFSGLMSMEPWDWTDAQGLDVDGEVLSGGAVEPGAYPVLDGAALTALVAPRVIKELGYQRIQGEHYYSLRTVVPASSGSARADRLHQPYAVEELRGQGRVLVHAADLRELQTPFSTESIVTRLQQSVADARIIEHTLLVDYDSYYYSRGRQAALPVLRIKFDDPMRTWVYVDPHDSSMVALVHKYSRVERWLYSGLHSLDFRFWYSRRPLWDIGMLVLLLGGLASSGIGLYLGIRRLAGRGAPAP
jgi:hypothetical protein